MRTKPYDDYAWGGFAKLREPLESSALVYGSLGHRKKNLDCATRWHIPGRPIEAKSTEFSAKGNRFFLTKVYESTKVHGRRLVKMFLSGLIDKS